MHWCVEGCSFQPFLKLCFLVKWLIFFPKVEFNICNDKYKNTYHPPIILRLIKVKTLKKFQHAFKKNICPLTLLCIYFSYIPSFNLEIAFFAPFILVFFRESKSFVFLSLKKKFFFFLKKQPLEPSVRAVASAWHTSSVPICAICCDVVTSMALIPCHYRSFED